MNVFLEQIDFIDRDPRIERIKAPVHQSYAVTVEIQTDRNQHLLPPDRIAGKRILDIGCCVGASGGWALSHRAAHYTGVELSPELAQLSRENLEKYHAGKDWKIIELSAEDFMSQCEDKFDIVLAAGIIYTITDTISFLRGLAKLADEVVIESMQPRRPWYFEDWYGPVLERLKPTIDELRDLQGKIRWMDIELPFTHYRTSGMLYGDRPADLRTLGIHPSLGAVTLIMRHIGFERDITMYDDICAAMPNLYNYKTRYAVRFYRNSNPVPMAYSEALFDENKIVEYWKDKIW